MTRVSVVILNYNGRHLLEKFLPPVISFTPGADIIVADNGSTDDSLSFLRATFPAVGIIPIQTNLGFCGGYNFAMRQIKSEYAILLNSDVEVTPGWATPVIKLLDERGDVAAAHPKILSYKQRDHFEYAGAAGGYLDALGYPFCRGRIFDYTEIDNGQYDDSRPVFWATGACMFIRTKNFNDLGGFDEDFFAHMEEIDLCWKLKRMGHKVFYVGQSTVYHVGGATLAQGSSRKVFYNFRNGMMLVLKHFRPAELVWKLPVRLMLDWLAAFVFLFGFPSAAIAVLKAHVSVLGQLGSTIKKRKKLSALLGAPSVSEIYPVSVVWRFFVLRRRTFRDLGGGQ
jgi:GT2 family glycosyltransferase